MSERTIERKVAAITGGAQGIGLEIARGFARERYSIALIDVRQDTLAQAAMDPEFAEVEVATIVSDVSDATACESAMKQALSTLKRVDTLVNNAGVGFHSALEKLSVEDIDKVLGVNTRAPILLARAVVSHMISRGSGSIINISSAAAKIGYPNLAPYSASKAALIGFTRALAIELAPYDIRVNAVCPGVTNTAMMANNIRHRMEEKGISYELALAEFVGNVPNKQMIEPEDIANAVLFLASDRARSITGEALNVSAGFVMW
jgi:NAD(P)-dependent dehydrogenase (short-subunit alcohol dehydrogenase family)